MQAMHLDAVLLSASGGSLRAHSHLNADCARALLRTRASANLKFVLHLRLTALLVFALPSTALLSQSTPPDLPDAPGATLPHEPVPSGPTIVIDTSMGRMTCKTFPQIAPLAVDNFIGLAEGTRDWTDPATHTKRKGKRLYDGLTFHRVIPGFMVQGGDPAGDGSGDAGYYFKDETDPNLLFSVPGRLAMANSGPNTNSTQFFITEQPVAQLNGKYSIFGQCDQPSVDVVTAIARVPRNAEDKPLTPVTIQHITVVREGQPMPAAPVTAAVAPPSGPALPPAGSVSH
ncbi:MAG: hypothetical protein NVSMB62_13510 [Acidobacteriaceae bacterium]